MAWVKMINNVGDIISVPESVYKDAFSHNEAYSLVQEPKPSPKIEKTKKEEVVDDGLQKPKGYERRYSEQGTKKTV